MAGISFASIDWFHFWEGPRALELCETLPGPGASDGGQTRINHASSSTRRSAAPDLRVGVASLPENAVHRGSRR
jgi:hypothetical protein